MTVLHRWFQEVWNEGSEAAIDSLLAPNVIVHGLKDPQGNEVQGPEAFKTYHRTLRSALSDIHIEVHDVISEGDRIAARTTVTARHTGDGLGLTPRDKLLHFTGISWARIEDGRIAEAWNEFDFGTMTQQMQ